MTTTVTIELNDNHARTLREGLADRAEFHPSGGLAQYYGNTVGTLLEKVLNALPDPDDELVEEMERIYRRHMGVVRREDRVNVMRKLLELVRERDAS